MPTDIYIWSAYLVLGVIAGLVGGLLGLGGGILIVPALLFLFIWQGLTADILMHLAVATSLFTIVFTSISSSYAHHKHQAVLWSQVFLLTPGIIVGAVLGALLVDHVSSDILRRLFGIFEILIACQIGFSVKPTAQRSLPGRNGMLIAGGGIGTLSTILGIGGGTLTVPFLIWCRVNMRKAVATSSACVSSGKQHRLRLLARCNTDTYYQCFVCPSGCEARTFYAGGVFKACLCNSPGVCWVEDVVLAINRDAGGHYDI